MSDLRIQYDEEMVGANHPTKGDTLNRLFLGGTGPTFRDSDGKVLGNVFKRRTSAPETGEGEVALFCKDDSNGEPSIFMRKESNGEVVPVAGGMEVVEQRSVIVANPGATGWQSASFPLLDTYDPDTHICNLLLPGCTLGGGYPVERCVKWRLNSSGASIDLTLSIALTGYDLPITYQIIKVRGLAGPIKRQTITASIAYTTAVQNITVPDPGGNYEKNILRINHILFNGGLQSDAVSAGLYRYPNTVPVFIHTSATNIQLAGLSSPAAANYTFELEWLLKN